jgi:hypothetical protein
MRLKGPLILATAALCLAWAGQASAQGVDEASSTGKGIAGGALLGAEVVIMTEAAIGVKPYWAYAVGGGAGAIAGGVGGYFLEQNLSAKTNMFLLAGGMVLAIPTTIWMLSATQYEPPANYVQDQGPTDEPIANPPEPDAATATSKRRMLSRARVRRVPTLYHMPPALVDIDPGGANLAVPTVALMDTYTREQVVQFGVKQSTEYRLSVLNLVF